VDAILKAIRDYLEKSALWPRVQPAFALLSLYVAAVVLGFQYIGWAYKFTPSLPLYLRSYVFRGITVLFVGIALLVALFALVDRLMRPAAAPGTIAPPPDPAAQIERRRRRMTTGLRFAAIALVLLVVSLLLHALNPRSASYVRVRFLGQLENRDALVYAIYELNRLQPNWQFDVDFTPLNLAALDPKVSARCGDDLLCKVSSLLPSDGQPTIVITTRDLNGYLFWKRLDNVALVSTFGSGDYGTLTEVEYLSYCLIVQAVALHLHNDPIAGANTGRSRGSLLESSPPREEFKARVLSAHLDLSDERILLNRFGIEYLKNVKELMTLRWLHSPEMTANLSRHYPAATRPISAPPQVGGAPAH
jgi:hypothetical protein